MSGAYADTPGEPRDRRSRLEDRHRLRKDWAVRALTLYAIGASADRHVGFRSSLDFEGGGYE